MYYHHSIRKTTKAKKRIPSPTGNTNVFALHYANKKKQPHLRDIKFLRISLHLNVSKLDVIRPISVIVRRCHSYSGIFDLRLAARRDDRWGS